MPSEHGDGDYFVDDILNGGPDIVFVHIVNGRPHIDFDDGATQVYGGADGHETQANYGSGDELYWNADVNSNSSSDVAGKEYDTE